MQVIARFSQFKERIMLRKILWVCFLALILAFLLVIQVAEDKKIQLNTTEFIFSLGLAWLALMLRFGWLPIVIIICCHKMLMRVIMLRALDLLAARELTLLELQSKYESTWEKRVRRHWVSLNELCQALKPALSNGYITISEDSLTTNSIIRLTQKGIRIVQECRKSGEAGLRRSI